MEGLQLDGDIKILCSLQEVADFFIKHEVCIWVAFMVSNETFKNSSFFFLIFFCEILKDKFTLDKALDPRESQNKLLRK